MIQFSKDAMKQWNKIPSDIQNKLLSNVFCSHCKQAVTAIDFTAQIIDSSDLLLSGICKTCHKKVSRLIENDL